MTQAKKTAAQANTPPLPQSLKDPLQRWLQHLKQQGLSERTVTSYGQHLQQMALFLNHHGADWSHLTPALLSDFVAQRIEQDAISTTSLQPVLSATRHFYTWLMQTGQADSNPAAYHRMRRKPRPLPKLADPELLSQLLDQPMPDSAEQARLWIRDKAMFELLYGSGLRVSELVGLNADDVIQGENGRGEVTVLGKGNKPRLLPIGQPTMQALLRYLPHRALWLEQADPALFISEKLGTRLSVRAVQQRLKICATRAGIHQNLHPHLLRHCFASHMLSNSQDLRAVQELLGHSNISTTQIYTQLDFNQLTKIYDQTHPRAFKKRKP